MAIYDNLPVFKDTYDLLLLFINQSKNIQRDFKYTIGQEVKKEIMSLCIDIYEANAAVEKEKFIAEARRYSSIIYQTVCYACGQDRGNRQTINLMEEVYKDG